jgi:hypothetical protein
MCGIVVPTATVVGMGSEMENKYSGTLLRLEGYITFDLEAPTPTPTEVFASSKPNEELHAISSEFTSYGFTVDITL